MTQRRTSNPTQRQIARLYTLAGQAGLSHAEVIAQLRDAYGVESTKRLTLPQYEEFVAWIKGRIGARVSGDARHPAREGQIWQRAQVARMLDIEWPGLDGDLRDRLTDVLDDFRLYRSTGRISASVLRQTIQRIARFGPELVGQACDIWLSRYRERDERYFAGICRSLKRQAKKQGKQDERQQAMAEHRAAAEMEKYGWERVGRLPTGEPVFYAKTTGCTGYLRGDEMHSLTGEQKESIIRGPDN